MSKINAGQAPSTLISTYIGSNFDAVLEVADNIETVKVVAENIDTFGVPPASETTAGIAEIATQTEVNQKTNDSHIVTPKKLGAYAAPLVHNHTTATPTESGFLAATDKQKLDGISNNANNYTHPTSGIAPGIYKSVAVDTNGHITSGTNPTTLAGYGITDAVLSSDVATTATASKILKLDANSKLPASITGNASTATKLTTARTINGVSFDGSANITVNAVDSTSRIASSEKGVANGVATLAADGKISSSQLPSYAGAVDSVAGKTGVVTLVKGDVGLGNVDNTSDINKPISTAQQSALALKANLASPALTGTPSAPTATVGTSTTQIATTAFVNAEIANDAAPSSHVGATGTAHGVATTSVAGFMSSTDKIKLDNISGVSVVSGVSSVNSKTGEVVLTKADVGLDLVNNTADLDKPISTATQTALNNKEATIALGTTTQYWRGDKSWQDLDKAAVGLSSVNNTSDLNKPISTDTQNALNGKANTAHTHTAADVGALAVYGTAVAASKLSVARAIAGKSFDGTADISITAADVGALPAAGTAVAATKLASVRNIAGIPFDGTANISIAASNVGALPASGGSISGNLFVDGTLMITNSASMGLLNSFSRSMVRGSSVAVNVFGNTTDAMYFDGNSLKSWQVRYNSTLYPIYHTGNKPTPAEIGAQPATSDIRVKSNIESLAPVLDKIMLIDPKTFNMEGREGTCVGTIAQDWEVDFPEVILNVPSTAQGEPEMLKGIDALGTIGILLKAIQELKGEIEELKNR